MTHHTSDITIDQWLSELARVKDDPEGAVTVKELSRRVNHSEAWVRKKLDTSVHRGVIRLTPVTVMRPAIDGSMRPTTAYKIDVTPRDVTG